MSSTRHCVFSARTIGTKRRLPWRHVPGQQFRLQNVSLSSQTTFQDPALLWAQSHPTVAQSCLNPPPIDNLIPPVDEKMKCFEDYLRWRQWAYPKEIFARRKGGLTPGEQGERAIALISHILSAPLTIGSQFDRILTSTREHAQNSNPEYHLRFDWCCVGARAEASIPTLYWKEFLVLCTTSAISNLNSTHGKISKAPTVDVSLDFVGPDIPPKLADKSVCIRNDEGRTPYFSSVSLRGFHRGFYHDIPQIGEGVKGWDAFLFFNPGFGHPNLEKSWESTLKLILNRRDQSAGVNSKALLLTAHSEKDALRDERILVDRYGIDGVEYHENIFASRVTYEDPFETNHFVRPNHYVATVQI